MTTRKILTAAAAMFSTMLCATSASATIFGFDYQADGVWNAYNDDNSTYGMKFTDDGSKDGFWLVVSDGPNPKSHVNEYAILYGDRANNRITAYTYDGTNGPNSYETGTFLGTYENAFTDAGFDPRFNSNLTMFTLDVAGINSAFTNPEWDGIQLGEQAGIWFHQSAGSNFEYGADGSLLDYTFADQMWLDVAYDPNGFQVDCSISAAAPYCGDRTPLTPPGGGGSVPAPGGLALLMAGLIGLRLRKRA